VGRHKAKWRVHRERPGTWVVEHPVYGRHAVMGSWERAYGRAFGAAVRGMEGR